MADTHYGDESVARKTFPTHRTKLPSAAEQAVHDEIVGHPLVSADDQIAVLAKRRCSTASRPCRTIRARFRRS